MITITGVDRVMKSIIKDYNSAVLNEKSDEFVRKLIRDVGEPEAKDRLSKAIYTGRGDARIISIVNKGQGRLIMNGSEASFIEFGTGIKYVAGYRSHPLAAQFGAVRGGYGHHLGRLANGWRYPIANGPGTGDARIDDKHPEFYRTKGNPANRVIYMSGKLMRQRARKIAVEVFKTR